MSLIMPGVSAGIPALKVESKTLPVPMVEATSIKTVLTLFSVACNKLIGPNDFLP